ncbi:hypothetical protein [Phycicoccus sp. 3266]|uniref:hypothetical protein n=1 Tax=Phycicoccus sp. 3266 TaxID=2817751 RepID=UPI0028618E81|nr:hypothetical protein [Phycicoccus sp. 3266]MDR6861978.1 hypothetical protein [Phycicoccus sp. 3266]
MIQGLGKPRNRHILLQLRTAARWGVPLGTIRHGRDPQVWTPQDRQAAVALVEFENSIHTCGHPQSESFDQAKSGFYEVDDTLVCHACAALEEYRKANPQAAQPGQVLFIRDTSDDET